MNYSSMVLAALGGTVTSFAVGLLLMWAMPGLIRESHNYPAIFRPAEAMKAVMPVALGATFLAILLATILYAQIPHAGSHLFEGVKFGVLIGLFVVCGFVLHNYVTLKIGFQLTLGQMIAYFVQWLAVGIVIGLIYRPVVTP